jgi:NADP-dependent alcohol dehydrogenase
MQNFDFYNPTHIVFGKERVNEIDNFIPETAKVLVLYDGGSVNNVTIDDIEEVIHGLESKAMTAPSEHGDLSLDISRQILEDAM